MPTGHEIMLRAGVLLNDLTHIRWPCWELNQWIVDGVRAIVLAKPSACSRTLLFKLVTGTRQTINPLGPNPPNIPDGFSAGVFPLMLIDIVRNVKAVYVGTDGVTRAGAWGRRITHVDRVLLETQVPNWHDLTKTRRTQEVRNFTFDEEVPTEYYVYPPNDGTGYVEAQVGVLPQALQPKVPVPNPKNLTTSSNDSLLYNQQIGLPEPYSVPLLDYVLYRCQMKDDLDGQVGRAAMHYQQFATALGIKLQVEKAHSPNARP